MTAVTSVGDPLTDQERRALLRPVSVPGPGTLVMLLLLFGLCGWSLIGTEISVQRLVRGIPNIVDFARSMWPPDRNTLTRMWPPIRDTLQMAIAGLLLSVLVALPVALLA